MIYVFALVWLAAGALHAASAWRCRLATKAARRAEALAGLQWKAATEAAEVALAQATAIGQSADLLCDDCRAICGGHYEATAGTATRTWLREHDA